MLSVLVSGASSPGLSPGRGHCVVFLGKTLILMIPLSIQVYKWYHGKFRCSYMKCNIMELHVTSRSTSFTHALRGLLDIRMHQDSSCSWSIGHCSSLVGVLVSVSPGHGDSLEAFSPPLSLPIFPLFNQCDRCLFFLLLYGGSWLGCLDSPAMGAVSI